jgi:uncharacterized membrane protein
MGGILFLIALVLIVLPIAGIVSYFKTKGMIRESLAAMNADLLKIGSEIAKISDMLRESGGRSVRQQEASAQTPVPAVVVTQPASEVTETARPSVVIVKAAVPEIETVAAHAPVQEIDEQLIAVDFSPPVSTEPPAADASVPPKPASRPRGEVYGVFARIWSWIVVGEEHRNPKVSMEYAVASTWLLRIGIIALVTCVAYFLRWSIDKGILGPAGRVALSVAAGVAMIVAGKWNIGKKYHLLGQGFTGGGIAFLYFAMYAAGPLYSLVSTPVAFGLMSLVTLTAGVLAVRIDSQLIAILGIVGGYATPVMLRSPEPNFPVLYSYLLLLGAGILGISHVKQWRLLNYLGFIFAWALFVAGLGSYRPQQDFTVAIVFLSLLFVLHSAIVYFYCLAKRKTSTVLEVFHLLVNGVLFAAFGYRLILEACGRPWPAVMTIALAVFYIVNIYLFLKKRLVDRPILVVLLGLGGFFTALTVPFITGKETLTVCWAILAFSFLWIGRKLDSNMLAGMATALYCIVLCRIACLDIPRNFSALDWSSRPLADYGKHFFVRFCTFGPAILSVFGAFRLFRWSPEAAGPAAVDKKNDIRPFVQDRQTGTAAFWVGIALLFTVLYLEFAQLFSYIVLVRQPVLTMLWSALAFYLLSHYYRKGNGVFLFFSIMAIAVAAGKLFCVDFDSWDYRAAEFVYGKRGAEVLMRMVDYGALLAMIVLIVRATRTKREPVDCCRMFKIAGTALAVIYATLETNTFFHWHVPAFQAGAVSVLWAVFAITFIVIGIRSTAKGWRYTGLVFFCIVVGKVFLSDLSGMETIYRVIAFMIVGGLLIAGSYVYIKAGKKFIAKETGE